MMSPDVAQRLRLLLSDFRINKTTAAIPGQTEKKGSATNITLKEIRRWLNGSNQPIPYALKESRKRWLPISTLINMSHIFIGIFSTRCRCLNKNARARINRKPNKNECVNPRWAIRSSALFNQNDAIKSISGKLAAIAPYNIAFLPIFLPKKRSPIQAPIAIWVKLSIRYFVREVIPSRTDSRRRFQNI